MAGTANYNINYDDERFTQVETQKQEALTDLENTYGGMISESDKFYQQQIDASKDWANQQQQIQQEQTDFAIEQVEQQKQQANKDYLKEQSGAYTDWQKQSNQYGANAEQMAAAGLVGTGFSESSQVGMYNTYQNRVATARQSYQQAILNYDNAIKDARLQNSAALAEIAANALQQELQLALEGFQYKNQLVLDLTAQKQNIENTYYGRWQDVLGQMNQENALAEEVRQYNESLAYQQQQDTLAQENWQKEYELSQAQLAEEQRQFNEQMAFAQQEWEAEQAAAAKSSGGGSGGSSGGSGGSGGNNVQIDKQKSGSGGSIPANTPKSLSAADTYGVFSNGYQPKGILGYGEVSKTGQTMKYNGSTRNVWKTPDGTLWYWNGEKYVKYGGGIDYKSASARLNYKLSSK